MPAATNTTVEDPKSTPLAPETPASAPEKNFDFSDLPRPPNRIQLPRDQPRRFGRFGAHLSKPPNPDGTTTPSASAGRVQRLVEKSFDQKQRYFGDKEAANRAMAEMQQQKLSANLSRQVSRRFMPGDVYAPHDLSPVEMAKWKRRGRPVHDSFDALNLNPIDHYRVCFCSHHHYDDISEPEC